MSGGKFRLNDALKAIDDFKIMTKDDITFDVVGSVIRKKQIVGDVDLLISSDFKEKLQNILIQNKIHFWSYTDKRHDIKSYLMITNHSTMMRFYLNDIHFEIFFYPSDKRCYELWKLFFTGSRNFNIFLFKHAKSMNISMGVFEIFKGKEKIDIEDKKELIFDELNLSKFKDPMLRN